MERNKFDYGVVVKNPPSRFRMKCHIREEQRSEKNWKFCNLHKLRLPFGASNFRYDIETAWGEGKVKWREAQSKSCSREKEFIRLRLNSFHISIHFPSFLLFSCFGCWKCFRYVHLNMMLRSHIVILEEIFKAPFIIFHVLAGGAVFNSPRIRFLPRHQTRKMRGKIYSGKAPF